MIEPIVTRVESRSGDAELAALRLWRAEGTQRLCEPFVFVLDLVSEQDQGLSAEAVDALVTNPLRVTIGALDVHGVVAELRLLPTVDPRRVHYRAWLVPALHRLRSTVRSRVFQDLRPPAVVAAVLREHGIDHQLNLTTDYPLLEYVVQYEEPDFDFVQRIVEHWGLAYFFEQGTDGEVLVVADDHRAFVAHEGFERLRFEADAQVVTAPGWIGPMERRMAPQPASITLRDYNWRTPFVSVEGTSEAERMRQLKARHDVDRATGTGEVTRYGEHFKDETTGRLLARVRAEGLACQRVTYHASFHAPGLAPGHRVETSGMPLSELDRELAVVEVHTIYEANDRVLAQRLTAIDRALTYRPPLRARRPKIAGFMHAVIDGEMRGNVAPIDSLGRYKVVMGFDGANVSGGRASRWVRMMQASSGANYGMHLPLHVGTEVAIAHLDGDPDRPVIAGALPNVDAVSPVVADNATQSRIRTKGNILFELEDDA